MMHGNKAPKINELQEPESLITAVDQGFVVVGGMRRKYLTQAEITRLENTYPEALRKAQENGMIPPEDGGVVG